MMRKILLITLLCMLTAIRGGCNFLPLSPNSAGEYYTTYSNLPGPPDPLDGLGVKGPFYISRISIAEESTTEILSAVEFSQSETTANGSSPNYNAKFTVEKIKNSDGQTVSVKVSSNAANDFHLTLSFSSAEDDMPAYDAKIRSDDGVHSKGGEVIPDPYGDPELPIAGFKELNFKCDFDEGEKIKDSLVKAGYTTDFRSFADDIYTVNSFKKNDSRAKIEKDVLEPDDWSVNNEKSKGNVGFYNKSGNYTGSIDISWIFSNVDFTIKLTDVKLEKLEDGEDMTSYTMSGTAEIRQKSFSMGDVVFKLNDDQKKSFSEEFDFTIMKDPDPSVSWEFMEIWEFVEEQYGTPYSLQVLYTTRDGATDSSTIPVESLDNIDGTDSMDFMMPAYGGSASWDFEPEK